MRIAFLHTADVHVATFDALLPAHVTATHRVRPDLLDRARADGLASVAEETLAELDALAGADAVICTCSTLGPLADQAGARAPHIFRIDRPMMETACGHGPRIAVALCLDSTRDATLALLRDCAAGPINPQVILCRDAWARFEAGDQAGYANAIARTIRAEMAADTGCIVLAQASMAGAADLLADCGIPVLTSPDLAVRRALALAVS